MHGNHYTVPVTFISQLLYFNTWWQFQSYWWGNKRKEKLEIF